MPASRHVAIAAGTWHSLVLSVEGVVLSFGRGGYGKLGHGDEEDQLEPKVIEALRGRRVVAIAAGRRHSMVLTEEGEVLSFGSYGDPWMTGVRCGVLGTMLPPHTSAILGLTILTPTPIPGLRVAAA